MENPHFFQIAITIVVVNRKRWSTILLSVKYTLSVKYQLEENRRAFKVCMRSFQNFCFWFQCQTYWQSIWQKWINEWNNCSSSSSFSSGAS